jgi:hypothetical protein
MATTAKRSRATTVSKPSARKSAARKPVSIPGSRKRVSAAATTTTTSNPVRVKADNSTATTLPKKTKSPKPLRATQATKAAPTKQGQRKLSAAAKKNLAVRHLWELVEEKKRRAAQPPSWQNIGYRDHSVSGSGD